MSTTTGTPILGALVRQEIGNYLRHKLFWVGAVVTTLVAVSAVLGKLDKPEWSTTYGGLYIAMTVGVLGMVVMIALVRRSDRAASIAGAVAVPQSTRTLALAATVVVPLSLGLLAWLALVAGYVAHPPTAPHDGVSDAHMFAAMFGQAVVATVGGPVLGLVLARWIPYRGLAALAAVLLVFFTTAFGGNFEGWERWRVVWWWTFWNGPVGWSSGNQHNTLLPGSPYFWVLYLVATCATGVLVALYRDPDGDHVRLRQAIAGTVGAGLLFLVLAVFGGLDAPLVHEF